MKYLEFIRCSRKKIIYKILKAENNFAFFFVIKHSKKLFGLEKNYVYNEGKRFARNLVKRVK